MLSCHRPSSPRMIRFTSDSSANLRITSYRDKVWRNVRSDLCSIWSRYPLYSLTGLPTTCQPHFQTPLYYLGKRGWHVVGKPVSEYSGYRLQIEQRSVRTFGHTLYLYDVILKFALESDVKRFILGEEGLWEESIEFGIIPDAWIQ